MPIRPRPTPRARLQPHIDAEYSENRMSNEIIDGDAELGDDGVLQGWCWNAQKPNERQIVEILIDDRIVSTSVASRFREDLRTRKIGDGYHGFMTTLSRTLAEAGVRFVVTARERGSGRCFWRHIRGAHALPGNFPERMDALGGSACPESHARPPFPGLAIRPWRRVLRPSSAVWAPD